MSVFRELLDYFNGRLEQNPRDGASASEVDKQKLRDLLVEIETMRTILSQR